MPLQVSICFMSAGCPHSPPPSLPVFSALRACALCWKDKRVFAFVPLVGLHKSGYHHRTSLDSPNKICTLYAFATLPQYTFVKLNISYATSPVRGCQFAPDMPDVEYEK